MENISLIWNDGELDKKDFVESQYTHSLMIVTNGAVLNISSDDDDDNSHKVFMRKVLIQN